MEKQFIPFEYVDIIMIVSTPFLALDMLIKNSCRKLSDAAGVLRRES